ncbi:MAG: hypothetical protein AAF629_20855 [Chloroflexota bacterium]
MRRSIADQISSEPIEVLAKRPNSNNKPQRDRSWEKKQRESTGVVTYRGIPKSLNEKIKTVASELGVPIGDVVRAFLENGLADYKSGDMDLDPELVTGRYTLFPAKK